MKDNVIFWQDWDEAVRSLPEQEQGEAYRAVMDYALRDVTYTGKNAGIKMLLTFLTPKIDEQKDRYAKVCERNRINGQNGGRPRKPIETQNNPAGFSETQNNPIKDKGYRIKDNDIEKKDITSNIHKKEDETAPKFSFKLSLIKEGVDEQVAADYMAVRNKHKAPSTLTAFNGLMREADKVRQATNFSLTDIIRICAERGWQGLKADWILKDYNGIQPTPAADDAASMEEQDRILREQIRKARAARGEKEGQFKDL